VISNLRYTPDTCQHEHATVTYEKLGNEWHAVILNCPECGEKSSCPPVASVIELQALSSGGADGLREHGSPGRAITRGNP